MSLPSHLHPPTPPPWHAGIIGPPGDIRGLAPSRDSPCTLQSAKPRCHPPTQCLRAWAKGPPSSRPHPCPWSRPCPRWRPPAVIPVQHAWQVDHVAPVSYACLVCLIPPPHPLSYENSGCYCLVSPSISEWVLGTKWLRIDSLTHMHETLFIHKDSLGCGAWLRPAASSLVHECDWVRYITVIDKTYKKLL